MNDDQAGNVDTGEGDERVLAEWMPDLGSLGPVDWAGEMAGVAALVAEMSGATVQLRERIARLEAANAQMVKEVVLARESAAGWKVGFGRLLDALQVVVAGSGPAAEEMRERLTGANRETGVVGLAMVALAPPAPPRRQET